MNSRLLAILCLGFSSGLPLALTSATLQAWFTEAHINVVTIGALSLLGMPYAFKFLWAPIMDQYGFAGLGRRKGWIMAMQFAVAVTLIVLANMQPSLQASMMACVALGVAFFSASQDIAITAYQTDVLLPTERGLGAACYIFAWRVATLISGGLALIFASYLGWKVTYEIMALLMLGSMTATYFSPHSIELAPASPYLWQTMRDAFQDLLQRDKIIVLLLFVVFYKFGDALALSLFTNFLLHGLGFSLLEVGTVYKVVSFVAMMLGAFVGGTLLTRLNIFWALFWFGIAQTVSNLLFVVLALAGKQFFWLVVAVFGENFCSGLSTAALFAFLMSLCNHRYSATQYALLSAVASFGRVFLGPVAGVMVEYLGWVQFYIWAFILCLPGLGFLWVLKSRVCNHAFVAAK